MEYGTRYGDRVVESWIAIPDKPQPFAIHIKSKGFIAEGLAVLVFADGQYHCNRNRTNLKPGKGKSRSQATEIDFIMRQKEKLIGDGRYIGRDWRFDSANIGMCAQLKPAGTDTTKSPIYLPRSTRNISHVLAQSMFSFYVVQLQKVRRTSYLGRHPMWMKTSLTPSRHSKLMLVTLSVMRVIQIQMTIRLVQGQYRIRGIKMAA